MRAVVGGIVGAIITMLWQRGTEAAVARTVQKVQTGIQRTREPMRMKKRADLFISAGRPKQLPFDTVIMEEGASDDCDCRRVLGRCLR